MTIELRLSNVDPPASEPKRTIYRDIVNLPDPVKLGLTIRYFNYDDVGLYMQITGSATGYTFGTVNLGLLASGANKYINLDELASRAKPTVAQLPNGEMSENITLTLKGYTDAGYTTLKWTFDRIVTVAWINSADAAFTVDFLDNFDDGTVDGWAVANEADAYNVATISVATDYVLSTPTSCKMTQAGSAVGRARLYKSFNTSSRTIQYAIFDIRLDVAWDYASNWVAEKYIEIQKDAGATLLIHLGKAHDTVNSNYVPIKKWIRLVVPITPSSTVELRIVVDAYYYLIANHCWQYLWLDDFKIISK